MFKDRHMDRSVILLCVCWYLAYNLSLRDLEELMAERGLSVDNSTVQLWVVHFSRQFLECFQQRKRVVTGRWHLDEIYIKVRGQWMYLHRNIESFGETEKFFFTEHPDSSAAERFFQKAFARYGRPNRIVINGSQTNNKAIASCDLQNSLNDRPRRSLKPIRICKSKYLNSRLEQDHRRINRRIRSMLGFKSMQRARTILAGIEMVHLMRKKQTRFGHNPHPSISEQFKILAA